jgi:hypothetical protein
VKERLRHTALEKIDLNKTRRPGTAKSSEGAERDRLFAERAAAIEKLKGLRLKKR